MKCGLASKYYMPADFDYSAKPHLKFMRFHTMSPSVANEGYNDLYITPDGNTHWDSVLNKQTDAPFFFVKEQQNLLRFMGDFNSDRPKLGVWETYELYLYMDTVPVLPGGKSRVRFWKNGKLVAELNDVKTLNTVSSYSPSFLLFTYWNGGNPTCTGTHPTKSQSLYIEDLVITTDKPSSRDALGNAMIGSHVSESASKVKPAPPTVQRVSQ